MSGGAKWWSINYFIDERFGDKEAKMETEDNTVNHENDVEKTEDVCPWPYLEEFFVYRGRKGDSVQMQCKLCLTSTVISAYKTSASNLKKHIEVRGFTTIRV